MVDNAYKNAFKEVYEILQNTDDELVNKVPKKFVAFLKDNMNVEYQTSIDKNVDIDKQLLLPETEDILSLIYRSYWATEEERIEIYNKDKKELTEIEENKKNKYKDINDIFAKRKNINNVTIDNSLAIIQKESFVKRLFKKILNIFKK